ncbi:MAG: filamentous hemagglutinin N-terminal domain-containing protein, partial [Rhodocyclales bacterium]|nr:filamentous hemagglutinin N-terminal domain-containing protein [Rhodocyclales bacterium]
MAQFRMRRPRLSRLRPMAAAIALGFSVGQALALPSGAQVVSGSAGIAQSGNVLTVRNSANAILNWQKFGIGADETVKFIQPSASSSVLNRVVGADPSAIYGQLTSNGRVWVINPAGIMVGAGGRIDAAGFVASTLNVANQDFLAGRMNFQAGAGAGKVVNQGSITTPSGGTVYLVGADVANEGVIRTPGGETLLAAGQTVNLIDTATPGVKIEIAGAKGSVTNLGEIAATAGRIGMAGVLVKNAGSLNASSVVAEGGRVFLRATQKIELADTSRIHADGVKGGSVTAITAADDKIAGALVARGELSAQGDGTKGSGGFVETSAGQVDLHGVAVETRGGEWLIDPNDFTIAASGGDMTGSALSASLGSNHVTISTATQGTAGGNGDIFVNDAVSWSADKTLTLSAERNIAVNANVTASGNGAGLNLYHGGTDGSSAPAANTGYSLNNGAYITLSGTNPSLKIGNASYTVINSANDPSLAALQGINSNLSGHFALGSDIDAATTSTWNAGAGFAPIGDNANLFAGTFDGLGHSISGLSIARSATDYVGMFGFNSGSIVNTALVTATVTARNSVGALVGYNAGLVGNSSAEATVVGNDYVGGLVGYNQGLSVAAPARVTTSFATGSVSSANAGSPSVGGLAGYNGSINQPWGQITYSYSAATVKSSGGGSSLVGGLVGTNYGSIDSSYSTGAVAVYGFSVIGIGGFVGYNAGTIAGSWTSSPAATSGSIGLSRGDFVGNNTGSISGSYWDKTVMCCDADGLGSNSGTVTNLVGLGTYGQAPSAFYDPASLGNLGFSGGLNNSATWWLVPGGTRPFLKSEWSINVANGHQLQMMSMDPTAQYLMSRNIDLSTNLVPTAVLIPNGGGNSVTAVSMWSSSGFVPIGDSTSAFTGTFDGQSHTLSNLSIARSGSNDAGLFGVIGSTGSVGNLTLANAVVSGADYVGRLAGRSSGWYGNIGYTGGSVTATGTHAGPLVAAGKVHWTGNAADYDWSSANNWNSLAAPGSGDSVYIDAAGSPTITLASGTANIADLTLGGTHSD